VAIMIRSELLEILACPTCDSPDLRYDDQGKEPILICEGCGARYGFENGMPLLYCDDAEWAPKRRESQGWVAMWKEMDIYDKAQFIPELPYVDSGPWSDVARMFDAALFQLSLRGDERVLDIGAGEGWAAQWFAQKGCHAVAIDIVADQQLGLGRAWKRMKHFDLTFDLLIGDNERLPFRSNSFDVVFASNALHHSDYLDKLLASVYKILRPGGRLVAVGDPLITIFQRESDATDGDREKAHGIIERRRRFYDYLIPFWQAGFRNLHFEDAATFWLKNNELYPWMDRERYAIDQNRLFGTTLTTRFLTQAMLRLPRPFALGLLLSLRQSSLLMISGQKRG
jgi:SAM-dependent methyltransferase